MKSRQDGKYKKENLKTWSEEAIDKLINCFQSHEYIWNVTSGDYKDQNRKPLPLDLICQCKNITPIDMTIKKWNNFRGQLLLFL